MAKDVTVVGAGIIGICAASYLQRAGFKVKVVDERPPGMATSYGNAGGLSSGSFVPLSYPGILKQVPKWLLDKDGPLVVRPGYLLKALPWLLAFLRAGRPETYRRSAKALAALAQPLFENLMPLVKDANASHLVKRVGQLHLYSTREAFAADAGGRQIRRELGSTLAELGEDEIRQMEPTLAPIFRHAVHFPDHGHCTNPHGLVVALAETLRRNGGEIVEAKVETIEAGSDRARAIVTSRGRIDVDELVVAAGAWSKPLAASLGHRVPLESQRGYHAMVAEPAVAPSRNLMWAEKKFLATPMDKGVRFAGTVEIAGLDAPPDYHRADILLQFGRKMFPGLNGGEVSRWMGHRPCLPDSVPVIGRSPNARNVTFAFGHGHIGLICASTTGKLVGEIVSGAEPSIDLSPYRIDRFR
ncbi:MAG: FAD-dependent oxidoreductase [Hyphomicrobiaceae bacterium]|nr:MAG: FAD-dependent oxidoreductase [Hyphomicrobiaceae bacterium]